MTNKACLFSAIFCLAISFLCAGQRIVQKHDMTIAQKNAFDAVVMLKIPGGTYKAFLKKDSAKVVKVKTFLLSKYAITNAAFLQFVKQNPQWSRSKAKRIYCDENYLSHWKDDFVLGNSRLDSAPVTNVSWFAAQAYCKWKGGRLPTLDEWEYAAKAPVAGKNAADIDKLILKWYSIPGVTIVQPIGSLFTNKFGLCDMYGLIWEWVYDFNSVMMQGDSRGAQENERNLFCGTGSLNADDARNYTAYMRYAFRNSLKGNYTVRNLGFRLAMNCNACK